MTTPFRMMKTTLSTLVVSISLAGCSAAPPAPVEDQATPEPGQVTGQVDTAPTVVKEPLTGQTLYQLLLAEIATNRREFGTAAELYSRLDQNEEDIEIAQRASALNQVVGNYERMQRHAEHWTTLTPNTAEAWQALSIASLAQGNFGQAETALNRWLVLNPNADVEAALIGTENLSDAQRNEMLAVLDRVAAEHPENSDLPFASAQLLAVQGRLDEALVKIRQARSLNDSPRRGMLEYRILLQQENIREAGDVLANLAERYPQNSQIATAYASFAYAEGGQDTTAVLESLFNRFPNEPVIVGAFARESFDNGDFDTAEALFNRLTNTEFADEAHYFLGRINRENARDDLAEAQFLKVKEPPYLISALAELSELWLENQMDRLIAELEQARGTFPERAPTFWRIQADAHRVRGELQQAFDALEQGLSNAPNDTALLYDQALIAVNLERYEVMESNLNRVLEIDPNDASALNALGYTWADRNQNLEQAQDYIDRALELRPDDPAIMDSKGWVEYRLGNLQTAEDWLRRALEAFDNDEVAAHLAEVLWQQGEQEEARDLLRHALELNPKSPVANEVIDRLGVSL